MQKPFLTALLLAAALGLTACDSEPQGKVETAKQALEHKSEQLQEAAEEATEVVVEKIDEVVEVREERAQEAQE